MNDKRHRSSVTTIVAAVVISMAIAVFMAFAVCATLLYLWLAPNQALRWARARVEDGSISKMSITEVAATLGEPIHVTEYDWYEPDSTWLGDTDYMFYLDRESPTDRYWLAVDVDGHNGIIKAYVFQD